jgi:hypothetical protein
MVRSLSIPLVLGLFAVACADDGSSSADSDAVELGSGSDSGTVDIGDPQDVGTGDTEEGVDVSNTDTAVESDTAVETDTAVQLDTAVETDTAVQEDVVAPEDTSVSEDTTPDVAPPTGAVLTGVVSRSGDPARDGDGIGNLYIAVLDSNPLAGFGGGGGPAPNAVGVQLIENADLSSTSTRLAYRIEGIPPRAEAYYISAFLDDDGNAEPGAGAEPDRGDLLNLESLLPPALPTLVMDAASGYEYDIDLNQTRPF